MTGKLRLEGNGGYYSGFESNIGLTEDLIWKLPAEDGSEGQALVTDGAKGLSWGASGAGPGPWVDISSHLTANHAGSITWDYALGRFSELNPSEYIFDAKLRLTSDSTDTGDLSVDLDGAEVAYEKQSIQVENTEQDSSTFSKYATSNLVTSNPTPVSSVSPTGTSIPTDVWQIRDTNTTNGGFAQPFTLASDTLITKADIYLISQVSVSGTIYADIVSTLPSQGSGGPAGNAGWLTANQLVDLGSKQVTELSGSFQYEEFSAAAPVLLSAGTYYLRIYTDPSFNVSNQTYVNKIITGDDDLEYWSVSTQWTSSASDIVYKLYEGTAIVDTTRLLWGTSDSRDSWNIDAQNVLVDRIPTWY